MQRNPLRISSDTLYRAPRSFEEHMADAQRAQAQRRVIRTSDDVVTDQEALQGRRPNQRAYAGAAVLACLIIGAIIAAGWVVGAVWQLLAWEYGWKAATFCVGVFLGLMAVLCWCVCQAGERARRAGRDGR